MNMNTTTLLLLWCLIVVSTAARKEGKKHKKSPQSCYSAFKRLTWSELKEYAHAYDKLDSAWYPIELGKVTFKHTSKGQVVTCECKRAKGAKWCALEFDNDIETFKSRNSTAIFVNADAKGHMALITTKQIKITCDEKSGLNIVNGTMSTHYTCYSGHFKNNCVAPPTGNIPATCNTGFCTGSGLDVSTITTNVIYIASIAIITCKAGYGFSSAGGSVTALCGGGVWTWTGTGTPAICVPCCAVSPPVDPNGVWSRGSKCYMNGDSSSLTCNTGYAADTTTGPTIVSCTSGAWGSKAVCKQMTTTTTYPPVTNATQGFRDAAAILLAAIDQTVNPCDDFYEFTCRKWIDNHPIPPDRGQISAYDVAQATIDENLAMMLGNINSTDTTQPKTIQAAALFYQMCVNYNNSVNNGANVFSVLTGVGRIGFPMMQPGWSSSDSDWTDLWTTVGYLESRYALGTLYQTYVDVDWDDVTRNALYLYPGPLSMPRDFYVKPEFKSNLDDYVTYVFNLGQALRDDTNAEITDPQLMADALLVVQLETQLAFAMTPDSLLRNYAFQNNEYTLTGLNAAFKQIGWDGYLKNLLQDDAPQYQTDKVVIAEPGFIGVVSSLISGSRFSKRTFANFVGIKFLMDNAQFLGQSYRDALLTFQKKIHNVHDLPPAATDCVELLTNLMPYSTGYLYVNSVPNRDSTINDVKQQTSKVIAQFLLMVDSLTWMSSQTKQAAHNKAKNLVQNIGLPDWLLNITALDMYNSKYIDSMLDPANSNSFWNLLSALKYAYQRTENFQLLEQAPDRKNFLWSPATVNAWYQPGLNSITFPFATFNPPYYRFDFPQAFNYAGQGSGAGHELTHGYDDEGVQFGPTGQLTDCAWNLCTWMDNNSTLGFNDMAQCVVNQYSQQCCPLSTGNVRCANGATTQGENIADIGGQQAAYFAYQDWKKTNNNGQEEDRLPGLE